MKIGLCTVLNYMVEGNKVGQLAKLRSEMVFVSEASDSDREGWYWRL